MASIPIARMPSVREMGYSPLGSFVGGLESGFQTGYGLKQDIIERKRKREKEDELMRMREKELKLREKESKRRERESGFRAYTTMEELKMRKKAEKESRKLREESTRFNKYIKQGKFSMDVAEKKREALDNKLEKHASSLMNTAEITFGSDDKAKRKFLADQVKKNPELIPYLKYKSSRSDQGLTKEQDIQSQLYGIDTVKQLPKSERISQGLTGELGMTKKQAELNRKLELMKQQNQPTQTQLGVQEDPSVMVGKIKNFFGTMTPEETEYLNRIAGDPVKLKEFMDKYGIQ